MGTEKKTLHPSIQPSCKLEHAIELTPHSQVLASTYFAPENATPELADLFLKAQLRLEKSVVDLSKCLVLFLTLRHLHLAFPLPFVGYEVLILPRLSQHVFSPAK